MTELRVVLEDSLGSSLLIERELTPGGMARVFVAHDTKLDRAVVIKVLDPDLAGGLAISADRFTREIKLAAGLQQANIVPVLNAGEAGGTPFYTMPYVEGESLRAQLSRGESIPMVRAIGILRDVARALEFAHSKGIVHRDIKPENILLSGQTAVVTDFGIAKALSAARRDRPDEGTLTQVGTSLGTPAYMAPEQVSGGEVDQRADIYSWGLVAYEVLTGAHPFADQKTTQQLFAAQLTRTPTPIVERSPKLPREVAELVGRCLEKVPAKRPSDAGEIVRILDQLMERGITPRASMLRPSAWRLRTWIQVGAGVAVVIAAGAIITQRRNVAWARDAAGPNIRALLDEQRYDEAFAVFRRAESILGPDPSLVELRREVARPFSLVSRPAGARVYRQPYGSTDSLWEPIGVTPLDSVWVSLAPARLRVELAGYRRYDLVAGLLPADITLRPTSDTGPDLITFRRGALPRNALPNGFRHLVAPVLSGFAIGRYEVTNREYKHFVDAGGYGRRELWPTQILRNGKPVSWDSAMKILVDRTGRPGPAGWEVGSFASGEEDYPVTGVSFYEAQAYATFAGLRLPTVYHWSRAASLQGSAFIIPASNIARDKLAPVGRFPGISVFGAFDMAGNAREWVLNAAGDNGVLMGGGYDDLAYMFLYPTLRDRFDRSPTNGFRLARYSADSAQRLTAPITMIVRDYSTEKTASDEVFNVYRRLFRMDVPPEKPTVVATDSSRDAIRERISIRTRFTDDALLIDVYRPRSASGTGPLPALLIVPGASVLAKRPSPAGEAASLIPDFVRSGRIVVVPILKGEWERSDSLDAQTDRESNFYRDRIVLWGKEFRIAVDYVVSRADVDSTRIAYLGISMGGRLSPILTVLEPRIKVAVLTCPGLALDPTLPEIDPFHYLPRMRIPTLMVGGRLDSVFPLDISQVPFFNAIGVSPDQKKHVVVDAGHCPSRQQFLREALPWLDKYLE